MDRRTVRYQWPWLVVLATLVPSSWAQTVTGVGVTIDRYSDGSDVTHCFCTDLFGTGIVSATVTAPSNANPPGAVYPMSFSVDEEQWAYDQEGTPAYIGDRFPDGLYQFDVVYENDRTESIDVVLVRDFPPFPEITSFNAERLLWAPWDGFPDGSHIEVSVEGPLGASLSCDLPTGATSCTFPPGFIEPGATYLFDILFLSSSSDSAYSNSGTLQWCDSTDADSDGIFDDGNCSGVVDDDACVGGATEGCDDNCRQVPNPDQDDNPIWFDFDFHQPGAYDLSWVLGTVRARSGQELQAQWLWGFQAGQIEFNYTGVGESLEVPYGECVFASGLNFGLYRGTLPLSPGEGAGLQNPSPGIITESWWLNVDGGLDDNGDDLLEARRWHWDACEAELEILYIQIPYPDGCEYLGQNAISPPTTEGFTTLIQGCNVPIADWLPAAQGVAGERVRVSPKSAEFGARLARQSEPLAGNLGGETMGLWPFAECDLDFDGDCDTGDRQSLSGVLGSCVGHPAYNPFADADASGCLEPSDEAALFDQDSDGDGVQDLTDNCLTVANAGQIDQDDDGAGASCDCADANPLTRPHALEVNDGLDNQCPGDRGHGIVDEIEPQAAFNDPTAPEAFCWLPQQGAASYEVVRASHPVFTTGCVSTVVPSPGRCWSEAAVPAGGQVFYYLVRTASPHLGSWGVNSSGVERTALCF